MVREIPLEPHQISEREAQPATVSINIRRIFTVLVAVDLLLVVIWALTRAWPVAPTAFGTIHEFAKQVFDLDAEASLPTWCSSMQLLLTAFVIYARANGLHRQRRRPWKLYALMAFGFAFLSADEVGMIHERIAWLAKNPLLSHGLWPKTSLHTDLISVFLYFAILIVCLAVLWRDVLALLHERAGRVMMLVGGAVYVAGAVFVDNVLPHSMAATAVEEGFELLGATTMLCAFLIKLGNLSLVSAGGESGEAKMYEPPRHQDTKFRQESRIGEP